MKLYKRNRAQPTPPPAPVAAPAQVPDPVPASPSHQQSQPRYRHSVAAPCDRINDNGGSHGLRVTDPSDARLHRTSTPVYRGGTMDPRGRTMGSRGGTVSGSTLMIDKSSDTPTRRHTVTVSGMDVEMSQAKEEARQREVFLNHLARRYPDHAHSIKAPDGALYGNLGQPRRQTTQVTYAVPNPPASAHHPPPPPQPPQPPQPNGRPPPGRSQSASRDQDDNTSMTSSIEGELPPGFSRGGRLRASLPVVRTTNQTTEKPLGLIFLIFRNETKRAMLPNEVTSIDTVRALFVRSFPDHLSMQNLEQGLRKIYILDPDTSLYYELEHCRDIKDKTVLKIYETDLPPGHYGNLSPSRSPKPVQQLPRPTSGSAIYYTSDSDLAAVRQGQPPASRSPGHQAIYGTRIYNDVAGKTQSLPIQPNYVFQHQLQQQNYATYANPELLQHAVPVSGTVSGGQPSATGSNPADQNPISPSRGAFKGTQHAVVMATGGNHSNQNSPQRMQSIQEGLIPNQRHSVAFMPESGASNYLNEPHQHLSDSHLPQSRSYQDYHQNDVARTRMAKMEAQLANLTAWVQTTVVKDRSTPSNGSVTSEASASIQSSMSDLSSAATPQPVMTSEMHNSLRMLSGKANDLRSELRQLRRLQVSNTETMRETMHKTCLCIKEVLTGVPSIKDLPLRVERAKINELMHTYSTDAEDVYRNLRDLEISVEEIRHDVLNKRCRVSMSDVESMALALSNVGRSLADLKAKFPHVQERTTPVLAGEMEVVVKDEKLASVQDQRAPVAPPIHIGDPPSTVERKQVLTNIQSMVPDHDARITSLEAADASRERKKKLTNNQDALRFEKELTMAQKKLKEPLNIKSSLLTTAGSSTTSTSTTISTTHSTSSVTTTATSATGTKPTEKIAKSASPSPNQKGQAPPPPVSVTVTQVVAKTTTVSQTSKPITSTVTSTAAPSKPISEPVTSSIPVVTAGSVFSSPSSNKTVVSSQAKTMISPSCLSTRSSHSPSPTSILASSPSPRVTTTTRVVFSGVSPLPKGGIVPNPSTSTPVSAKQHVTFNTHVTEIAEDGAKEQSKKIPPPPPPRKSSRPGGYSSPQTGRRSSSPPAYENIDNFVKGESRESRSLVNGNGYQQRSRSEPAKHTAGARVHLPPTSADVAALYAVPSTCRAAQQKKSNGNLYPDDVTTNGRHSDSDSTTSSVDSQTISLNPDGLTNGKVKMRDGKKVPPPPPVRRTSTLSTQSSNQSQNSNSSNDNDNENDKRKSVAELQQHFILEAEHASDGTPIVNGGVNGGVLGVKNGVNGGSDAENNAVQTIVTKIQSTNGTIPQQHAQPNKNYAETEIF